MELLSSSHKEAHLINSNSAAHDSPSEPKFYRQRPQRCSTGFSHSLSFLTFHVTVHKVVRGKTKKTKR